MQNNLLVNLQQLDSLLDKSPRNRNDSFGQRKSSKGKQEQCKQLVTINERGTEGDGSLYRQMLRQDSSRLVVVMVICSTRHCINHAHRSTRSRTRRTKQGHQAGIAFQAMPYQPFLGQSLSDRVPA